MYLRQFLFILMEKRKNAQKTKELKKRYLNKMSIDNLNPNYIKADILLLLFRYVQIHDKNMIHLKLTCSWEGENCIITQVKAKVNVFDHILFIEWISTRYFFVHQWALLFRT